MSNLKKCLLVLFAAFVLFSLNAADKHQLKVSLNKPNGIYTKGDTVELKIEYFLNRKPAKCPVNIVMVFPDGSRKEQFFAEFCPKFTYVADKSPFSVQFTVTATTPDRKPLTTFIGKTKVNVKGNAGIMVDPHLLKPGFTEPADFDKFWNDSKAQLAAIPIRELERKEVPVTNEMLKTAPSFFAFKMPQPIKTPTALEGRFKSYDVKVACLGAPVSGYLTIPVNAAPKSLPVIVSFHGAPGGSARQAFVDGAIRFDVNPHGFENGHPRAYYKQKFQTTHRAYQFRNRFDRNKFYLRGMYLRVKRALDYVKTLPEYDGKNLIVVGNSQGGAQALIAGGIDPDVKLIYAAVAAFCDHGGALAGRQPGWPKLLNPGAGKIVKGKETEVAYFDAAFFARRIKAEIYMTVGLMDVVCSPTSVFCAYNNIPGKKHLTILPYHGHSRTYSLEFNKRVQEVVK